MFLGSANFGEAAHFVSTLAFFNLVFISFTPIILYFTKVEHWSSFAALPWGCLCGMAGLWLGEWPLTVPAVHRQVIPLAAFVYLDPDCTGYRH